MMLSRRKTTLRGFTLIELLVVIAIIGLLSSVVLVAVNIARTRALDSAREANLVQVQQAVELYFDDNSLYPKANGDQAGHVQTNGNGSYYTEGQCAADHSDAVANNVITGLTSGGYIAALPTDPLFIKAKNQCCYSYTVSADQMHYKYLFYGCSVTGSADGTGPLQDPVHTNGWSVYSQGAANLF